MSDIGAGILLQRQLWNSLRRRRWDSLRRRRHVCWREEVSKVAAVKWRFLSTDSNKVDEPFMVEEAETVNVPPPPSEKLLVLGRNGFVGSNVCKEALNRGLTVASLSR
ncbi:hypothetical protein QQ045_018245 [Rhodiola kirilowii]